MSEKTTPKNSHAKIFFSHKCYCQTILKTHANYIYFVSRRYYYIWKENIFTTIRSFPYAAFNARYNIFADGIFVFVFVTRICRILISLNWNTFFPNLIIKQKMWSKHKDVIKLSKQKQHFWKAFYFSTNSNNNYSF